MGKDTQGPREGKSENGRKDPEAMESVMDSRILRGLQNQGHRAGKSQQTHC